MMMTLKNYTKGAKAEDQNNTEKPSQVPNTPQDHPKPVSDQTPSAAQSAENSQPSSECTGRIVDMKHTLIANFLFQQQCSHLWVGDGSGEIEGVCLRKEHQEYICCPPQLMNSAFYEGCKELNAQAAMTVNSRIIRRYLQWFPYSTTVPLAGGLSIQILPIMDDLAKAQRHQFAAFISSQALLVVWDDEPMNLVPRTRAIETELMELLWKTSMPAPEGSTVKENGKAEEYQVVDERGEVITEQRPTHLLNAVLVACTIVLVSGMLGGGFRQIVVALSVDKNYLRICFIALIPVQIFFTLFFAQVIAGCITQFIGPVKQMKENSKYYSAVPPHRIQRRPLPHITIQCPVYKEGLAAVIAPTVKSVKKAMSTYELQGGSANLFINDDGLQLLNMEERQKRIEFYTENNIGWVARPKNGENGFKRKGKFKKASNMNFGLTISCKVEEKLAQLHRSETWKQEDEARESNRCLEEVLREDGRAWAGGDVRVGEYIVLVDSDTRVPADCLLDAASEMEQSPEVAIMQFSSGVMQVVHTYFENGITFFTNLIYSAIKYTVSNGDVAPFVGHNAILRWSAIQEVAYHDEEGNEKFWSESHVSEDFDMALRLQVAGYTIRLAAWAGEGFKEGVSLTVYDELARWEKYAYGCNELLFHPIRYWIIRGPFTQLFRRFLFSNIRLTSKITIISYIGTYYAIGSAWILTVANYFAIGWYNGYLDKYYIDSFQVWFSIVIVFIGLGNVALAVLRYRIGERPFFSALLENVKWIIMFAIFLGGLSLHVSQALLAHMFEVNMTWGATAKEAEFSNFFIEVPKVLRRFKFSFAFGIISVAMMIAAAKAPFVPPFWRITDFVAILPLATLTASHLLLPIALNPALMVFSW